MRKIKNKIKIRNKVKMKQVLSVLLCGMLLVSGYPQTAFAEEIPEFTGTAESSFEDGSTLSLFGDGTAENVQEETRETALLTDTKATTGAFKVTGGSEGTDYSYSNGVLTVNSGANITVSMSDGATTPTSDRIVVAENATATITLNGVNITGASYNIPNDEAATSPIDLAAGATLTVILNDNSTNTLTGGPGGASDGAPGVHVPEGAVLIIQGSGSLSVNGGTSNSGYGGVGIGGKAGETEASGRGPGENCGTVIILTENVTPIGGDGIGSTDSTKGADIGGGRGEPDGGNGQGIKPTGDDTYTVFGDLTLPCDITIPEGAAVVIPEGASLTVPEGKTLTNNGTLLVQGGTLSGSVTGNQPAYPSEVTVAFSKDGQSVTSVPYGSTITVTATMKKAESAANTLRTNTGKVDFYLGAAEGGTKLNQDDVAVTQGSDGTCTAELEVTIEGENWKPSDNPYTITADFGGYIPGGDQGGDSLAPNTGSAQLTVTKAQQAAPTGMFLTMARTESKITLHFSDSSQTVNKNGVEVAYAVGTTADAPTSVWTTASQINSTKTYSVTIEQLSPGTPYIFFARYKGNDFHEPSPAITGDYAYACYTKPKITTESLPNAYVGVPYSHQLEAQVADGIAVRWSISNGSLPAGLTLSADGIISGTPTAATPQAVSITVCATFGEGADTIENNKTLAIAVTKSDAELGNLTLSGNTGIPEGTFQYGDTIRVTFTPRRQASAAADTLTPDTATLTYTPDGGEPKQLATASAQADGSFTLTYDTKQKMLPIKANLPLTVSYGGSGTLNPVTETVFVTLQKGMLRNRPSISGSFAYGETLTVNYTKQDDETVSYQWLRSDSTGYTEIDGESSTAYTLTEEDIGKHIYVEITPAYDDEWHTGLLQSAPQVVTKAPQTAPSAPTAAGTTKYSVTLNTIPANANGAAEYGISKDGGKTWTWQSGPEFTGLSSGTTYQFAARYGETDKYMTSDPSAPVNIATDRHSSWDPPAIGGISVSPKQFTLEKGGSRQFTAEVEGTGSYNKEVIWSISGQTSSQTVIGEDGILTIGKDENASVLTVTATAAGDEEKSDTAIVTVVAPPIPAVEISKVLIKGNQARVFLSGEAEGATGYDFVIGKDRDCIQTKEYYKVNKNVLTTDTTFYYVEQGTYYAYCHAWRRVDGKKEFGGWSAPYEFTVESVTPEQPKITRIRVSKKTIKITYTRSEGATGYDLVLGKAVKKVNGELRPVDYGELVKKVYNGNTVTATFKNVEKGTYYAGLHAYNRTSEDGKKVFSPWSKAKKIRVK